MAAELQLDLSRHCVETEIKKRYNQAVSRYFRADSALRRQIEKTIELSLEALETLDFNYLRSVCPPLAGRTRARIVLKKEAGELVILVDGARIAAASDIPADG